MEKVQFPSDAFLEAHFGPDQPTWVTLKETGKPLMLYSHLRYQLDACLRIEVMRIMRQAIDKRGSRYCGMYVVKYGILRPWAKKLLQRERFDFTNESQIQLTQELLAHCRNTPFHHDEWWEWFVTEDSLGAKLAPHANPHGGNSKPISLRDLFNESPQI